MFRTLLISQLNNIRYAIEAAFYLSFWDKKRRLPPQPPIAWPGFILGLALGLLTFLTVTGCRFGYENLSSLWITLLAGFRAAQKKLKLTPLASSSNTQRSRYQIMLGSLAHIAYLPGYVLGLIYGIAVQLLLNYTLKNFIDCISFFWNLSIYDLRQVVDENSKTVIGTRNFFGIQGYLLGLFIGIPLALITLGIRWLREFLPGLQLGLMSQNWKQDNATTFQDVLRLPSYALGFFILQNFKVFLYLQHQLMHTLFQDKGLGAYAPRPVFPQAVLGVAGAMLALPSGMVVLAFGLTFRLAMDSATHFILSLREVLGSRPLINKGPHSVQTMLFGAPGKILGYGLGIALYLPAILLVVTAKWLQMRIAPRFKQEEQHPHLEALKSLYGLLNNYQRQFPANLALPLSPNPSGGKGSYCFISKVIHLNKPTVSEIYLDEILRQNTQMNQDKLIKIKADLIAKFGFQSADLKKLDHAHQLACQVLAPGG